MVARGDITPEEARTHPRKNLITRALGSEERIRADLYEKELQPGDFLLLCSDGLSNIVTDQELLYEAIHGGVGLLPAPAPHHSVQRRAGQRYGGPLSDRLKGGNELWIST